MPFYTLLLLRWPLLWIGVIDGFQVQMDELNEVVDCICRGGAITDRIPRFIGRSYSFISLQGEQPCPRRLFDFDVTIKKAHQCFSTGFTGMPAATASSMVVKASMKP